MVFFEETAAAETLSSGRRGNAAGERMTESNKDTFAVVARPRRVRITAGLLVLSAVYMAGAVRARASAAGAPPIQDGPLPFSCTVFSASTSEADLGARFGPANVKTAPVPWGGAEGDYTEGTVLFAASPDAKLEVHWHDRINKREPDWVSVRGKQTRWHSPGGITLGTPLRTVERLNGAPFRLIGFGSDASGTVMSWSGGRLDAQNTSGCRVRLRLGPDWDQEDAGVNVFVKQLRGEREFSSGHPAMQGLNPTVNELFLQYDRRPRRGSILRSNPW